ncbi:pyrroloquinoline quinone biosynthesis protein B [Aquimarina amphilecti]|uniref:Pyrroloquinoline quinone biosynthesis protein B n=1 Tax=Aquimarina amphilecti TaxID=1038014 RepID=A0A1H7T1W7_AQUAM|nr:MBL fold metallo-hydrolase [Aquimarina amphilecti]SEL78920.1 pyrroloquinoline quinone biosynthesis protein B [Aquimarina amphilecti]
MNSKLIFFILSISILSCKNSEDSMKGRSFGVNDPKQYITILGIAQDGGYPHINNTSEFIDVAEGKVTKELVVSLGIIDKEEDKKFLIEATPDLPEQLSMLDAKHLNKSPIIDGVFLTHAHIGHYTGLMYFGREAMGSKKINVFAMPKMKSFLENNGPWSQLVDLQNIVLQPLKNETSVALTEKIKITPFLVPHRDEFSETVGYKIDGSSKSALFIPDINKWSVWKNSIVDEVKKVDYAFIDATFFKEGEIPRPMAEVPHPFIQESINLFKNESKEVKSKIIFIHFNHSNPLINPSNKERIQLEEEGYRFANTKDVFEL